LPLGGAQIYNNGLRCATGLNRCCFVLLRRWHSPEVRGVSWLCRCAKNGNLARCCAELPMSLVGLAPAIRHVASEPGDGLAQVLHVVPVVRRCVLVLLGWPVAESFHVGRFNSPLNPVRAAHFVSRDLA
jgi:hypothetical protein